MRKPQLWSQFPRFIFLLKFTIQISYIDLLFIKKKRLKISKSDILIFQPYFYGYRVAEVKFEIKIEDRL